MAGKRAEGLLEMMFFIEKFTLNRAWNGLSDEELTWEPMPGSWTVGPVEQCRTPTPFLVEGWAVDFDAGLAAATVPLTSIAWLFWHVGSMPGRAAALDFLGDLTAPRAAGPRRTSRRIRSSRRPRRR